MLEEMKRQGAASNQSPDDFSDFGCAIISIGIPLLIVAKIADWLFDIEWIREFLDFLWAIAVLIYDTAKSIIALFF
jgi:hypothetical protein